MGDAPGWEHEPWSPDSWRSKPAAQQVAYEDPARLDAALRELRSLPPLVTSWEIERLKSQIAEAQQGKRFILQGGDCAELLSDCTAPNIANKLKILLQMSLVLVHAAKKPVTRVGRFAGQYAKPRSSPTETRTVNGAPLTLPSYFGDLINRAEFEVVARRPDPFALVRAYERSALTLNFVRSLVEGGFADLHHPEYWDLKFFKHASLSAERRAEYERMTRNLADGLRFMEALGERSVGELNRVEFFTSHEGLHLLHESAQTRQVPRRTGWYNLTTHLPWIGERTRQLDGAHVEFFRGLENPVGIKIGPRCTPTELVSLVDRLNPRDEPGKLLIITRLGAGNASRVLPAMVEALRNAAAPVLWVCDPMHGNGMVTSTGIKTRSFDAIRAELEETFDTLNASGSHLGGVHFELTGEDVTECVGGASGVTEAELGSNYATGCDPRLNYQQSLELAFILAGRLRRSES
ncbi:MAG: 3-deoxy-7-phosphoheptulonate synthase class II [Planctomycetota bacterium]|nr:3-deoxy-7-phosphoheptulonate synthase class II [Planctomycetota bacterium]